MPKKRWCVRIGCVFILVMVILTGLVSYALCTEHGTQVVWRGVAWVLRDRLIAQKVSGDLIHGVHMEQVAYHDKDQKITLDHLDTQWHVEFWPLSVTINKVDVHHVYINRVSSTRSSPLALPHRLTLPLTVLLKRFSIDQLEIHQSKVAWTIHDILLEGYSDHVHHTLVLKKMVLPCGVVQASAQLNGLSPFNVLGELRWSGEYHHERYDFDSHISGTLAMLAIQVKVRGGKLMGVAKVQATPFAKIPVRDTHVVIDHLNPQVFAPKWPNADIHLTAQSKPIHDGIALVAYLDEKRVKMQAEAEVTPDTVRVQKMHLTTGSQKGGEFELTGVVSRKATTSYSVHGNCVGFNPSMWLSVLKSFWKKGPLQKDVAIVPASVNAHFEAQGTFLPQLHGKFSLGIHDSIYNHLPMTGEGVIEIEGKHVLPSYLHVSAAGNQLTLKGQWGNPSDQLVFSVHAPTLSHLGLGISGVVDGQGQLRGVLVQPDVWLNYQAKQIAVGVHRIAQSSGRIEWHGYMERGQISTSRSNASIVLKVEGYQAQDIVLNDMVMQLNGTYGDHHMNVQVNGRVHNEPLALRAAVEGQLHKSIQGYEWGGIIHTLENKKGAYFSLETPLAVNISPHRVILGAARLRFMQASIVLNNLSYEKEGIYSKGYVRHLSMKDFLTLQHEWSGHALTVDSDLVLDSEWDVALSKTSHGFFIIKRHSGDVVVQREYGKTTLGLSELGIRADIFNDRIKLGAQLVATQVGTITAQGQTSFQLHEGVPQLSPESPLSGKVMLSIAQIQNIGLMVDPAVKLNGHIQATLIVSGHVSQPRLSGSVEGDKLSLLLMDQGIQLHDGVLNLALHDNSIELHQVEFHGGNGTLKANGRIQLGQSNPDLQAMLSADHLQLYADPQRTLVLSGSAKLFHWNQKYHLDGVFNIDKGVFDLPKEGAPHLGDDVVIVHSNQRQVATLKPKNKITDISKNPASSFPVVMDLQVNLGNNFRFKGSGADVFLRGTMAVHAQPDMPLRATGTVRMVDGTYEVFGQKLSIEHGLIDFQGPLENPNVNILAMRHVQDVQAGIQVTGTVQRLRPQLVSEPSMADEEKISWLMFGHGTDNTALGQQQAVGAALALLANTGSKKIAQGIGLDEISVGKSDVSNTTNDQQEVISLGKAISDRLYVGYERSLDGVTSLIKATWRLSRRWSLVVRTGVINSLDVSFSKRFD